MAVALASAFCAGARLLLWRMHPAIPGLGRWALAGVAAALALLLLMSFDFYPWKLSLLIAQLLVVLGLILGWDGFRRFLDKPPLSPPWLFGLATVVVSWLIVSQIGHSILLLALGNAVLIAFLSGLIARDLLFSSKPVPPAVRATGWVYATNAIIFLLRAVTAHQGVHGLDPLNPSGVAVFMLLWWLCMTIAVTLGMILMTSERLQADLDSQANLDPLTGAYNRRAFSLIAEKATARARRYDRPLSLLIMDLDNFKMINDQLGHDAGDTLLCRFVASAKRILRGEDMFCRFGGEEFVALLPDATAAQAYIAAERLRKSFSHDAATMEVLSNRPQSMTVSIGIAELQPDEDIDMLLRRADTALYQAKADGRDRCKLADMHYTESLAGPEFKSAS